MDDVIDLADASFTPICPVDQILLDTGVGALVDGQRVAVFRLSSINADEVDEIYAIDGTDPFSGVPVLSRGLVGSVGDEPIVASPLHKQRFNLQTGQCLDDESVRLTTYVTEVVDGVVFVSSEVAG